jgi:hypothetical protein
MKRWPSCNLTIPPVNLFHNPATVPSMPTYPNPAGNQNRPPNDTSGPDRVTPAQLAEIVKEKPWSRITFRITVSSSAKKE